MGYRLATATLGPLLLLQGRHVRRVTPRLAEAAGPRDGTAGDGPPLRLLIVGDSAAAGVGVPVQARALSGQLVAVLAATHRVSWRLIARTGWTTRDLLAQLEAEPSARFDVAVTSLGVNETTDGVPPARWLRDQAALVALLSQRFGTAHVLLSAVPPMGLFPALPQPLRGYLGMRARRLDTALARWAASRDDCEHLPFAFPLEPGMMRQTASTRAKPPARCGRGRSHRRSGVGSPMQRERRLEGIAKAKAAGVYKGRPASVDAVRVRKLKGEALGQPRSPRRSASAGPSTECWRPATSMSRPIDHHHQLISYLAGWCGPDGKVIRYFRPSGRNVVASPIAPKNTGYEPRLYSLDGYPEDQ